LTSFYWVYLPVITGARQNMGAL